MNDDISLAVLLEVQKYFGLPSPTLVEKDWHVIRALRAITAVDAEPFRLVFAGGTGLARAHRLVHRMSEDVDFKIVSLDTKPVSGNKLRQQLGELRDRITASLLTANFPIDPADESQLHSRDSNRYTTYQLRYEEFGTAGAPLRPTIQIELSYASLRLSSVTCLLPHLLPKPSVILLKYRQSLA